MKVLYLMFLKQFVICVNIAENLESETLIIQIGEESSIENVFESAEDMVANGDAESSHQKWIPRDLMRPLDTNLACKIKMTKDNGTQKITPITPTENCSETPTTLKSNTSRRRPAAGAVALNSNEISKIYTQLCQQRLELTKIEKEIATNRLKAEQSKSALEIEILKADLDIKKAQLKKYESD